MDAKARRALLTIRACVALGRFLVLPHFRQRLAQRGLLWTDVLTILEEPGAVAFDGCDDWRRPKWRLSGTAADGETLTVVCVLDVDERGETTVFITVY